MGFGIRSRGWILEFWLVGELNLGLGFSKGSVGNGDLDNQGFSGIWVRALVFGDEDRFGVMIWGFWLTGFEAEVFWEDVIWWWGFGDLGLLGFRLSWKIGVYVEWALVLG